MTDLVATGLFGEVQSYAERHRLHPREAIAYLIEAGLAAEARAMVEYAAQGSLLAMADGG